MNIEEYIASGKLEAYALGMLDDDERAEVERMASEHPRIQEELDAIEHEARQYAEHMSETPPPGLKQQILSKLSAQSGTPSATNGNKLNTHWLWIAATGLLLVLAASGWWQWFSTRDDIVQIQSDIRRSEACCDSLHSRMTEIDQFLQALQQPGIKHIPMKAAGFMENAYACIYYQPTKERVFLDSRSLPSPGRTSQYQLWGIVDGQPTNMGLIDKEPDQAVLEFKVGKRPQVFAITLEPEGGNESPTMEKLVVRGQIKS